MIAILILSSNYFLRYPQFSTKNKPQLLISTQKILSQSCLWLSDWYEQNFLMELQNNIKHSLLLLFLYCMLFSLRFTSNTIKISLYRDNRKQSRKTRAIIIYVTKYENDVMENATLSTFIILAEAFYQ